MGTGLRISRTNPVTSKSTCNRFRRRLEKWQVSSNGGGFPQWRGEGRELFFGSKDAVVSVDIDTKGRFNAGAMKPLFPLPPRATNAVVTPDGQRFLIGVPADDEPMTSFTVVLNWSEGLKY